MSKGARLVKVIDAERIDTSERVKCLRLQAFAWRSLALIATHDPKYAAVKAKWLMTQSVPFVNGPALEKFIADHETMTEEYAVKSGVFEARNPEGGG